MSHIDKNLSILQNLQDLDSPGESQFHTASQ